MKFVAVIALTIVVLIPSSMARFRNPICSLPPFKNGHGDVMCLAHFPSWSYSSISNECVFFIYGGCGGNENRFGSKEQCEQVCKL